MKYIRSKLFTINYSIFTVIAGCTSLQPMDSGTRAFLARTPGAVCGYAAIVQTKSGDTINVDAKNARFDSTGRTLIMHAPKFVHCHDSTNAYAGKLFAVPTAGVTSIGVNEDITLHTHAQARYTADAGDWSIIARTDSGYTWVAQHVRQYKSHYDEFTHQYDNYKTFSTTAVESYDIADMSIPEFDLTKTAIFVGAAIVISVPIVLFIILANAGPWDP